MGVVTVVGTGVGVAVGSGSMGPVIGVEPGAVNSAGVA